ncbi:tetratricopeptide repeat protein [Sandaracinus amylolyticus]|uniref:tetratricopeptide repeat protein n=1 Tax=Sandaracinus amylolyticus TaxID=927083 RepID=UPI001F2DF28D|nr:tetratricopeptide repeat protein [Sandaracinus amylolyticus]UJR84064.1 Hypothetical protein I5071_61350 [Sandaracinus amylolyticus]
MRIFVALSFVLALAGCCTAPSISAPELVAPDDPRWAQLEASQRELAGGDFERALQVVDGVVAQLAPGGDPALEAAARSLRGEVLTALGSFEDAIAELERARALRLGLDDAEALLATTHALASALDYVGRYPEAEAMFRDVLERRRAREGALSVEVARAAVNLGICLEFQGRAAESAQQLEEGVRVLEALDARSDAAYDAALNSLGNIRRAQGDVEGALAFFQRALVARERTLGPTHPSVAIVLHNIAIAQMDLGRPADALAPIERALQLRRGALPPDHPWLVESEALHRDVLIASGRAP